MGERRKILMACPNYWSSPFQVGSHHIARAFANAGWDVMFVSDPISPLHFLGRISPELMERWNIFKHGGISDVEGRVLAYVPLALLTPNNMPLLRSGFVVDHWHSLTNPNVIKKIRNEGFGKVDMLYFDSVSQYFWLENIQYSKSVLRIADRNKGFDKFESDALCRQEQKLAERVDQVVYTSSTLEDYVRSLHPKKMFHLPNGVNYEHFTAGSCTIPEEYGKIEKPIVVYVGAMDVWFDFDLVNQAAARLPNVSFVMIGPDGLARKNLRSFPNIHILGRKPYSELPAYLHNADVGIIPFHVDKYPDLVNSVNPLKLYEYFACGLPVVAVSWEELRRLQSPAMLCRNADEFTSAISKALASDNDKKYYSKYCETHDWSDRVEVMLKTLE